VKLVILVLELSSLGAAVPWREELAEADKLTRTSQNAAADRVYQQILEQANGLNAAELNALGLGLYEIARYRDAEWAYRRSLEAWDKLGPKVAASRSITAGNLGSTLQIEGRFQEAEPLFLDRLHAAERFDGADSRQAADAITALAEFYRAWGRPEEAEKFARRAESILSQIADATEERIASQRILAAVLLDAGRYAEGEELLRGLIDKLPERAAVGAYNDLAVAETWQQHFKEAKPWAEHALELARRVFPPKHRMIAVSLNNLAQIQRFEGRYLEAEANYREAIAVWEQSLGPRNPDTAKGIMNLAAFYHDRGRESGAEDLYRRASSIFESSLGKSHPFTLVARNELGEVLRAEHRYSESERLSRATLGPLENSLGDRDSRVIRALSNYARLLQETRRAREAAGIRHRIAGMGEGFRNQNP